MSLRIRQIIDKMITEPPLVFILGGEILDYCLLANDIVDSI